MTPLAEPDIGLAPETEPLGLDLREAVENERQQAMRALLRTPMMTAGGSFDRELSFVRRHAEWLRDWLGRNTGWSLQVTSELARLRKTPSDLSDSTRPARDARTEAPFSRRRYVLFCLSLAALEREERQTTLRQLAGSIVAMLAADPALHAACVEFDLTTQDERRDIVQVVRLLLNLGVMRKVQGEEQDFVDRSGDVLYTIHRAALAAVPSLRRPPSVSGAVTHAERLAALTAEPVPATEESRTRRLRWSLVRRLLDDPVLYYTRLDDAERAYLTSQRSLLLKEISEATGLLPEVRAEGIAMVDVQGDATDRRLPEEGTDGHVALLVAEHLAGWLRRRPDEPMPMAELERHAAALIEEHKSHWKKELSVPGAEVELSRRTVEWLEILRLAERTPEGGVRPLPAVARYSIELGERKPGRRPRTPKRG